MNNMEKNSIRGLASDIEKMISEMPKEGGTYIHTRRSFPDHGPPGAEECQSVAASSDEASAMDP